MAAAAAGLGKAEPGRVDVAILGGGIAGLWLLAELRRAGYSALLLEREALGAGQTLAAQGIIHSGVKYAIGRGDDPLAGRLAEMPEVWGRALSGAGSIDLSTVPLRARHCHLWLPRGAVSAVRGFFASRVLRARAHRLAATDWPAALARSPVGAVYELEEPVVDVPALIHALAAPHADAIKKIGAREALTLKPDGNGGIAALSLSDSAGASIEVHAARFVFAAGAGNESLLGLLPGLRAKTQRRPLRMLMVKGDLAPLYGHCFERGDIPRLTITSHRGSDGMAVWYVGGALAETGADQDEATFLAAARKAFAIHFPALDQRALRLASFLVDRAEAARPGGRRPEGPSLARVGNVVVAWPTKLVFAPLLAETIRNEIAATGLRPADGDLGALRQWPHPGFGLPPWERALPWQ